MSLDNWQELSQGFGQMICDACLRWNA